MQLDYRSNHIYRGAVFSANIFNELLSLFDDEIKDEIFNEGLLKATSGSLEKLLNYELEIDDDN